MNRVRNLLVKLLPGGFWRDVIVIGGGAGISQVIALLGAPFVTRLYEPSAFGLLAVFSSLLSILGAAACFSYQFSIPVPKDDRTALELLVLSVFATIIFGAFTVVLVTTGLSWGLIQDALEPLEGYLWLIPIGVILFGAYSALSYWAVRSRAYSVIGRTRVWQSISRLASEILFALTYGGPLGLLLGFVLGRSAGIVSLGRVLRNNLRDWKPKIRWMRIPRLAFEYRKFPLFTSPGVLVNAAGSSAPMLIFAWNFGAEPTGWFQLAHRVVLAPVSLIGLSVGQVYLGEMSNLVHEAPHEMVPLFLRLTKRLALLSLIPVVVIVVGGGHLTEFVFGPNWFQTGEYLRLMAIFLVGEAISKPVSQIFNLMERQGLALVWNIVRLAVVIITIHGTAIAGASTFTAVLAFSIGMFMVDGFRLFLVWRILNSRAIAT